MWIVEVSEPKYSERINRPVNHVIQSCMEQLQKDGMVSPHYENWTEFVGAEGVDAINVLRREVQKVNLTDASTEYTISAEKILTHILIEFDVNCVCVIRSENKECRIG